MGADQDMGIITTESGIEIPVQVAEALREIRETAEVNMLAANEIQRIADREGLYALVEFIDEHRVGSRQVRGWMDVLNTIFREDDDE